MSDRPIRCRARLGLNQSRDVMYVWSFPPSKDGPRRPTEAETEKGALDAGGVSHLGSTPGVTPANLCAWPTRLMTRASLSTVRSFTHTDASWMDERSKHSAVAGRCCIHTACALPCSYCLRLLCADCIQTQAHAMYVQGSRVLRAKGDGQTDKPQRNGSWVVPFALNSGPNERYPACTAALGL